MPCGSWDTWPTKGAWNTRVTESPTRLVAWSCGFCLLHQSTWRWNRPHHFMVHEDPNANAAKNVNLTSTTPEARKWTNSPNLPNLSQSWISGSNSSREHGNGSAHSFCCRIFAGNLPPSILGRNFDVHIHTPVLVQLAVGLQLRSGYVKHLATECKELPQIFCCSLSSAKHKYKQTEWSAHPSVLGSEIAWTQQIPFQSFSLCVLTKRFEPANQTSGIRHYNNPGPASFAIYCHVWKKTMQITTQSSNSVCRLQLSTAVFSPALQAWCAAGFCWHNGTVDSGPSGAAKFQCKNLSPRWTSNLQATATGQAAGFLRFLWVLFRQSHSIRTPVIISFPFQELRILFGPVVNASSSHTFRKATSIVCGRTMAPNPDT